MGGGRVWAGREHEEVKVSEPVFECAGAIVRGEHDRDAQLGCDLLDCFAHAGACVPQHAGEAV